MRPGTAAYRGAGNLAKIGPFRQIAPAVLHRGTRLGIVPWALPHRERDRVAESPLGQSSDRGGFGLLGVAKIPLEAAVFAHGLPGRRTTQQ